jgi:hypothetical protein
MQRAFLKVIIFHYGFDQKSKSIRKYAGRAIALEKLNYKTSKIA